jgi:hypothetical protein
VTSRSPTLKLSCHCAAAHSLLLYGAELSALLQVPSLLPAVPFCSSRLGWGRKTAAQPIWDQVVKPFGALHLMKGMVLFSKILQKLLLCGHRTNSSRLMVLCARFSSWNQPPHRWKMRLTGLLCSAQSWLSPLEANTRWSFSWDLRQGRIQVCSWVAQVEVLQPRRHVGSGTNLTSLQTYIHCQLTTPSECLKVPNAAYLSSSDNWLHQTAHPAPESCPGSSAHTCHQTLPLSILLIDLIQSPSAAVSQTRSCQMPGIPVGTLLCSCLPLIQAWVPLFGRAAG